MGPLGRAPARPQGAVDLPSCDAVGSAELVWADVRKMMLALGLAIASCQRGFSMYFITGIR